MSRQARLEELDGMIAKIEAHIAHVERTAVRYAEGKGIVGQQWISIFCAIRDDLRQRRDHVEAAYKD